MTITTLLQPDNPTQPMRVLLLGRFGQREWCLSDVTSKGLSSVMQSMQVSLTLVLEDEPLSMTFESIADFTPVRFTERSSRFQLLKGAMADFRAYAAGEVEVLSLDDISALLPEVEEHLISADDCWVYYNVLRKRLDEWVSAVLSHPEFIKLERNWSVINQLLQVIDQDQLATDQRRSHCVLTLLNVSKSDVHEDLRSVSTVQDSQLFERIYSDELGQFGGLPYHVINPMFEFSEQQDDVELLLGLASIAGLSQCVVNAAISAKLVEDSTLTDEPLVQPRFFTWRALIENPVSRYLCLTAGSYQYRNRYDYQPMAEGIGYSEPIGRRCLASLHAWYIQELAQSFLSLGTALGTQTGANLASWITITDQERITPERRHILADLGVNTATVNDLFAGFETRLQASAALASIGQMTTDALLEQRSELVQLQNQFARQLKVLIRESLGHSSPEAVEEFVRQWLAPYIQTPGLVSRSQAQRRPLSDVDMAWQSTEQGGQVLSIKMKASLEAYNQPIDLALTVA